MTLAQFFKLRTLPHAIVVGPRAHAVVRKPARTVMLAISTEHGDASPPHKLLSRLIASRKPGAKK